MHKVRILPVYYLKPSGTPLVIHITCFVKRWWGEKERRGGAHSEQKELPELQCKSMKAHDVFRTKRNWKGRVSAGGEWETEWVMGLEKTGRGRWWGKGVE